MAFKHQGQNEVRKRRDNAFRGETDDGEQGDRGLNEDLGLGCQQELRHRTQI